MKNYTKEQLQEIISGYGSVACATLDWYDGPILSRTIIGGKFYYYLITNPLNFTVMALKFNDKHHAENEVFCLGKINALLENSAYLESVVDEAYTIHFQESGDVITPIEPSSIPRYDKPKCLDLALCEYLINGANNIVATNNTNYKSNHNAYTLPSDDSLSEVLNSIYFNIACHSDPSNTAISEAQLLYTLKNNGAISHKLLFFKGNDCFEEFFSSLPVLVNLEMIALDRTNLETGLYELKLSFETLELTKA